MNGDAHFATSGVLLLEKKKRCNNNFKKYYIGHAIAKIQYLFQKILPQFSINDCVSKKSIRMN